MTVSERRRRKLVHPGLRRIRIAFLLAAVGMGAGGLAPTAAATGLLQASVTPAAIDWTSNCWVTVAVSNLPPGGEAQLGLYADVNGNGAVDAADRLLVAYRVRDGVTNDLQSSLIVDDDDGAVNGRLTGRIAYFGQDGPLHVAGRCVWEARTPSNGTASAAFTVTQPTSSVWITGSVIDYLSSNAIAGAAVWLEYVTAGDGPTVWTDTNGHFRIYLPAGVSTADVRAVATAGFGYFNPGTGPGGVEPIARYAFTADLQAGANDLPIALRLVGEIPGMIYRVSGHVYDEADSGMPGVMVQAEWDDDSQSLAITDTNGAYVLVVPSIDGDEDGSLYTDPSSLMGWGRVAVGQGLVVTGSMTGVDLHCPAATLLARGTVTASDNGEPLAGATVSMEGSMFGGHGVSVADGTFEVALLPYGDYSVDVWGLEERGFVEPAGMDGLSVLDNSVTNLHFTATRCYPVTGVVYDERTNTVTSGLVGAFSYPSDRMFWQWDVNTGINRHGEYRLLAPTGALVVVVADVPGCVGLVYSNHPHGEWDSNHVAEPVLNTTAGVGGIDFYLPLVARIEGTVLGNGEPLENIFVMASEMTDNGWEWRGGENTDANGFYSLSVPPGSNYAVEVWLPDNEGLFWLPQIYDHVSDPSQATPVITTVDAPATNVDFDLIDGGIISGWVYREDGSNAIPDCWVKAETLEGDFVAECETTDEGYYEIVAPPGVYRVYAQGSSADYGVDVFYDGWLQYQSHLADAVTASVGQVTSNINFSLPPGCTISGRVTGIDGSTPVPWCWVEAQLDGDGMAQGQANEDGYYSFRVPPGTYKVEARPDWDDMPYLCQYFSNAVDDAAATALNATNGGVFANVDFRLTQAQTISGYVYQEDGTTPLPDCHVFATDYDSNTWIAGTDTESDGAFYLHVPPGRYRVRAYPAQNGLQYESRLYDNTYFYNSASEIVVGTGSDVGGIDFVLEPAGLITGHVYADDGTTPLANCHIGAEDCGTGEWMAWAWTDDAGGYTLVVPGGWYRVRALPSVSALPYVDLYYENAPQWMGATPVEVAGTGETGGIDIHLSPPSYVAGRVTDRDTDQPLAGMSVSIAMIPDPVDFFNNWVFFAPAVTDSNGCYSVAVPSGSNYIVQTETGNSYYPFLCWSNQTDRMQATLLTVDAGVTVSNIDFELVAGGRITGHVVADESGAPLGGCDVAARDPDTGAWLTGTRTDTSGYYSLALPAGLSYKVEVAPQANNLPYEYEYFDDTTAWEEAAAVPVTLRGETGGIDFGVTLSNLSYDDWRSHFFSWLEQMDPLVSGDDADPDGDGANNGEEFIADTNPRMSNSVLRVTRQSWEGEHLRIEWQGGRWARQIIERCEYLDPMGSVWTSIYTNDLLPTGPEGFVVDPESGQPSAFYRIKVER